MKNPLENLKPSFGPFAPVLENTVLTFLALVWILAILICAGLLMVGIGKAVSAWLSDRTEPLATSGKAIGGPIVGLVLLSALAAIVGLALNAS